MLYAGSNLDKARQIFTEAISHRPRIRLTIRRRMKATPTHSRTVTISEATQIEPMGSWPWESGYAIQQWTQAI